MTVSFLRACLQALFWIVVTGDVALAASSISLAATSGVVSLPWDQALLSFVICTFSGVAALLRRIDRQLRENGGVLERPLLFCAMHLFGSWAAGGLAFVLGQIQGFDVWKELGLMIVGSYLGAAFFEWALEKVAPGMPAERLP